MSVACGRIRSWRGVRFTHVSLSSHGLVPPSSCSSAVEKCPKKTIFVFIFLLYGVIFKEGNARIFSAL